MLTYTAHHNTKHTTKYNTKLSLFRLLKGAFDTRSILRRTQTRTDDNQTSKNFVRFLDIVSSSHSSRAPLYSSKEEQMYPKTNTKIRSKISLFRTDFILNLINIQSASPMHSMYKLKFGLCCNQPITKRVRPRQVFTRSN